MKMLVIMFWISSLLMMVACNDSQLGSENESLKKENTVLKKEIANLKDLLGKKLRSLCDTLTVEQKLKWAEYYKFEDSLFVAGENAEMKAWQKKEDVELKAWQKKEAEDTKNFCDYQKNYSPFMFTWLKNEKSEFSEYATLCFIEYEAGHGMMKYYDQKKAMEKKASPSMSKYLEAREKEWALKEEKKKKLEAEYELEKSRLDIVYKTEIAKIKKQHQELLTSKKTELGI